MSRCRSGVRWVERKAKPSITSAVTKSVGWCHHMQQANWKSNSISIIDAIELKMTREIKVGDGPRAFGMFLRR